MLLQQVCYITHSLFAMANNYSNQFPSQTCVSILEITFLTGSTNPFPSSNIRHCSTFTNVVPFPLASSFIFHSYVSLTSRFDRFLSSHSIPFFLFIERANFFFYQGLQMEKKIGKSLFLPYSFQLWKPISCCSWCFSSNLLLATIKPSE